MKNIQVTVAGENGAGKTTIAQFIAKCLVSVGIEAHVQDGVQIQVSPEVAQEQIDELEKTFQPRLKELIGRDDFKVDITTSELTRIAL